MFAGLLSIPEAVLLGLVEGITEFLPISSTGHLLIVGQLIGLGDGNNSTAIDTYSIAIQFGAILAIVWLYRMRLLSMIRGVVGADVVGRRTVINLAVAFLPAAIIGFGAGDAIKNALFGPVPIVFAWAVGGLVLIRWRPPAGSITVDLLTPRMAFVIGIAQVLAMWPGVSRSLVTLIAALALGMTMSAALEFSFLLGLITLSAATFLDMAKHGGEVIDTFGLLSPTVGLVVAFVTALIAVKWLVTYLEKHSLAIFGWYRIAIAIICGVLLLTNTL